MKAYRTPLAAPASPFPGAVLFLWAAFSLAAAGAFAEELRYASNSMGMPIRPLEAGEAYGGEYTLFVYTSAAQETRRLLDSGQKEVRRWERLYTETGQLTKESVFKEGVCDSITLYYPSGLVKEEVVFVDGREDGRFVFVYPSGPPAEQAAPAQGAGKPRAQSPDSGSSSAPLAVTFSRAPTAAANGGGKVQGGDKPGTPAAGFRDEYSYLPSGSFRGVKRIYDDGAVYSCVFESRGGMLFEEWHSYGNLALLFRYNSRGSLGYSEEYRGGVLVEKTGFRYDDAAPFRLREKTTLEADSLRLTLREYADDGLIRRESVSENGVRVAVTDFSYTDGLLIRKERRHRKDREQWEYFYNEEKKLARENYSRDGHLVKILYYETKEDHDLVEEYFRGGEFFLRLYFKDGEEVRRFIAEDIRVDE